MWILTKTSLAICHVLVLSERIKSFSKTCHDSFLKEHQRHIAILSYAGQKRDEEYYIVILFWMARMISCNLFATIVTRDVVVKC